LKTKKQIQVTVSEEFVGQRLDRFLITIPEILSRSYAQDLIEKNLVSVDQKVMRASFALKLNQTVIVEFPEVAPSVLMPFNFPLDIIYEDRDLIVINKPSGLVVHPAVGHEQDTLVNALLFHTRDLSMKNEQRPGIVHRIDKETSGLLVVAKNDMVHEALALQFKNKSTHRVYYALVEGQLNKKSGTIQTYLARHPTDRKKYASVRADHKVIKQQDPNQEVGKWAVTHFERLAQTGSMTYLKIKLETGRTHQIRVHLSEQGNRLVGDLNYGYSSLLYKKNELSRFYLHAAELGFIHPRTSQDLFFKVGWPEKDLEKIISFGFKHELFKQ
jgi:23S rRNA pseudouridine1911/1915/1917 synthase